jgi:hypothetical protein
LSFLSPKSAQPEAVTMVRKRQDGESQSKKRPSRVTKTSEERWSQLQREYQRAVSVEYPNPDRRNCPGVDALRDLAERNVMRQDLRGDPRWKHAIQCGPCYEEYIALKDIRVGREKTG